MSLGELLVILMVALLVIKPERLPEIAYLMGKTVARFQMWFQQFRNSF